MQILRVEKPNGYGPYYDYYHPARAICNDLAFDTFQHPAPHMEGLSVDDNSRFGFVSARQLVRWFSRECRRQLANAGCQLVAYQCPKNTCRITMRQAMFDITKAERLWEKPLSRGGRQKKT